MARRELGAGTLMGLRDLALPPGLTPPRVPGHALAGGGQPIVVQFYVDSRLMGEQIFPHLDRYIQLGTGRG